MAYFSIILPVFNGEEFISDSVASVIAQTFEDWELIIVDDGSTDTTALLAERYAKDDSRIKIFTQPNQGLSEARNRGLSLCKGSIIGFLDVDDIYLPECLKTIFDQFGNTEANLIISSYFYFKGSSKLHSHYFSSSVIPFTSFLRGNLAPPVAHFISSVTVRELGGFDITLKSCEDWDFWIRAAKLGAKIHSIPDLLVGYRYVPYSMSRNPGVMYEALTEVSRRAGLPDLRLPANAPFNVAYPLDYPEIQKNHLIRILGVLLHQAKPEKALDLYLLEKDKWNWELKDSDWKKLSSYLSWAYFFEADEIRKLISETKPILIEFFLLLGYKKIEAKKLVEKILSPQIQKMNHHRYGVILGAIFNRVLKRSLIILF